MDIRKTHLHIKKSIAIQKTLYIYKKKHMAIQLLK